LYFGFWDGLGGVHFFGGVTPIEGLKQIHE
jgi:hypothetical protein